MNANKGIIIFLLALLGSTPAFGKSGDVVQLADRHPLGGNRISPSKGICICPRPPPVFFEDGMIVSYWEPFLLADTVVRCLLLGHDGRIIWGPLPSMNWAARTRVPTQRKSPTNRPLPRRMPS